MNSIIKTSWRNIKHEVRTCNLDFFQLVENISPELDLPVYVAEYCFGTPIGLKNKFHIPSTKHINTNIILGSNDMPNDIAQDLSYGKNSSPLGLILDNYCEWSYSDEDMSHPYAVQGDGTIFNQKIIFNEDACIENNTISLYSGAKSIFMLPYIGCQVHHEKIKNILGITQPAPKSPDEHYDLFKEILIKTSNEKKWSCKILYFTQEWVNHIKSTPDWLPVKYYFSESLRKKLSSDLYSSFYNDLFMTTKTVNKYRPTPFLIDTAKYIFSLILGKSIGYKPAEDSKMFPIDIIQNVYQNIYELPYVPTIMVPSTLTDAENSVYYSLQQPSKKINTFKIRMNNSTYRELVALKDILLSYLNEFKSHSSPCFGSDLSLACQNITLDFFHNKPSALIDNIQISKNIIEADSRFTSKQYPSKGFSSDAKFFRGCIKISKCET